MDKLNEGLLYISLHNYLVRKVGAGNVISRKELLVIVGKHFLLPKNLRECLLKEMVQRKLVERKDRDSVIILDCKIDIEKDANKLYQQIGMF
jgi:hypothetical protein